MAINDLCLRKILEMEVKSSLTRLIYKENKASKKCIINCISNSCEA